MERGRLVVGEPLDHGEQRRHRLRCAPGPHGDVGDLIAGEVERGEGGLLVFQQTSCRLVMVVLGIEGGEQDARVEKQRRHGPGRVAFTCSAARPPWGEASLSSDRIAAARPSRRRRSAASANSRMTALRVVPPRRASASTSARRSSGRETMTFAMRVSLPRYTRGFRGARIGQEAPQIPADPHELNLAKPLETCAPKVAGSNPAPAISRATAASPFFWRALVFSERH